jgi:hypothetical protein
LDPTYLPAHVTRALAGLRCGDHHAASEAVAAIRDIDPSLPVLSRIESRLAEAEAAVAPTPE